MNSGLALFVYRTGNTTGLALGSSSIFKMMARLKKPGIGGDLLVPSAPPPTTSFTSSFQAPARKLKLVHLLGFPGTLAGNATMYQLSQELGEGAG